MPENSSSQAHAENLLDDALAHSFPASDPPSSNVFDAGGSCGMESLEIAAEHNVAQASGAKTNMPVAEALNTLLAGLFNLYVRTKGCHWHVSGPHFRDYHRLFDEQATEILSVTDTVAERVRTIGATTIDSLAGIVELARVAKTGVSDLRAPEMLATLLHDNRAIVRTLRLTRTIAERARDHATCAMIDDLIEQAEGRAWVLLETVRQ